MARQGKADMGASGGPVLDPYLAAMRFDDRAADRQANTHSIFSGREEALEEAVEILWSDAWTIIIYGDDDLPVPVLSAHDNAALSRRRVSHRLSRIHGKIEALVGRDIAWPAVINAIHNFQGFVDAIDGFGVAQGRVEHSFIRMGDGELLA